MSQRTGERRNGTFRHVRSAPSRRTPHLRFDKQPGARLSQGARVETATIAIRVPGRGSTKRRTLPDAGGGTYAVRQKRVVAFYNQRGTLAQSLRTWVMQAK